MPLILYFLNLIFPTSEKAMNNKVFKNKIQYRYSTQLRSINKISLAFGLLDGDMKYLELISERLKEYISLNELIEARNKIKSLGRCRKDNKSRYVFSSVFLYNIVINIPQNIEGLKIILDIFYMKKIVKKAVFV